MKNNRFGRLSMRAVIFANFTTFATLTLLMLLAGGFGLWTFTISELSFVGASFWVWGFIAWAISVGLSSFLAASTGRATTRLDGILYGVTSWATTCVLLNLFLWTFSGQILGREMTPLFMWGAFIADAIVLGSAVYGGITGSEKEMKIELEESKQHFPPKERKLERAVGN